MSAARSSWQAILVVVCAVAMLSACGSAPKRDLALEQVRAQLDSLKSDEELAGYAPLALGEAERALRMAESATGDETHRNHLVYMADRRIQIARAVAQRAQLEAELDVLRDQERQMRVEASRLQAEQARREAERALMISQATAEEAERAREEAALAREQGAMSEQQAEQARQEAEQARRLAETRASEADLARREAVLASQQADTLRRQLENLQLRQTESGVVVTLGDVLFATGQAELVPGARASIEEVVDLLESDPTKPIRIEGHTDSTGSAAANLALSERRAQSVRDALVELGVDPSRLTVVGLGEDFPIASNDTDEGRARNRRVDVILLDETP